MSLLASLGGCGWAARGQQEPFVDVLQAAPGVVLELRYATPDNFAHQAFYPAARCLLRASVAERLARVQRDLDSRGLSLKLWDCYRPLSVQRKLWALVPDPRYVADPAKGSRHNRGAAVDATLVYPDGRELEMPSAFDDFSERARRGYKGASELARANARSLEEAMHLQGFTGLATEWWHFDAAGWRRHSLSDEPLAPPARPAAH